MDLLMISLKNSTYDDVFQPVLAHEGNLLNAEAAGKDYMH